MGSFKLKNGIMDNNNTGKCDTKKYDNDQIKAKMIAEPEDDDLDEGDRRTLEGCQRLSGSNIIKNWLNPQELNSTQPFSLTTTVPPNVTSKRSLGDKHAPTRNSLRHSRMIVHSRLNCNGNLPSCLLHKCTVKGLPFIITNYRLVKTTRVVTIIIGILMSLLSVWFVLWTPTLTALDFPYWSAAPVLFSGIIGCFFLGFCPKPFPGRRLGYPYQATRFVSICLTSISIMACLAVVSIAMAHLIFVHQSNCTPHDKLNATCVCSSIVSHNATMMAATADDSCYHYEDLTCDEVRGPLIGLLVTSCALNMAAIVVEAVYLWAHWISRPNRDYLKIATGQNVSSDDS